MKWRRRSHGIGWPRLLQRYVRRRQRWPAERSRRDHQIVLTVEFAAPLIGACRIQLATIYLLHFDRGWAAIVSLCRDLDRYGARQQDQIQPEREQHGDTLPGHPSVTPLSEQLNHLAFLALCRGRCKDFAQVFGPIWVSPRAAARATCFRRSRRRASRSSSASLTQSGQETPSR